MAEFGGLHGIVDDLDSALRWVRYLLDEVEDQGPEAGEAFSTAIVVRYARALKSGVRDKAHAQNALQILNEQQRSLHASLMEYRDKHVAHSVSFQEEAAVVGQYTPGQEDSGFVAVSVWRSRSVGFDEAELASIAELIESLLTFLRERLEAAESRILPDPLSLPAREIVSRYPNPHVVQKASRGKSRPSGPRRT